VDPVFPSSFYHGTPALCQGFTAPQLRRKSNAIVISRRHSARLVAELPASATYTRSIFTFTLMAKSRLLLACVAAFISTFALGAEPATRQAATPGEKTPTPPKEPAITFSSVHVDGPY